MLYLIFHIFSYSAYEDLREHFREAHFLCEIDECIHEKFTRVFRTDIDFRAHRAQVIQTSAFISLSDVPYITLNSLLRFIVSQWAKQLQDKHER